MQELTRWLEQTTGLGVETQAKLLSSLVAVLVVLLLRRLLLGVVWRRVDDVRVQYQWKKVSAYVAFLLASMLLAWIWFRHFSALATYLGLLSAGIAIALREPLVNLAGWSFLIWRRPFEVGDRIQVGDQAGDVIDIRIFQFTLLEIGNWVAADQSTGRVVHIPNGRVFSASIANYTRGFQYIWNEIPVLVTFESDWRKAKAILSEIAAEHSAGNNEAAREQLQRAARKFMIFYSTLTSTVYTSVEDSGVLLTIRYLCDARQRRGSAQAIWEETLERFAACDDVDFAYPTQRFYDAPREGSGPPGGGAPS